MQDGQATRLGVPQPVQYLARLAQLRQGPGGIGRPGFEDGHGIGIEARVGDPGKGGLGIVGGSGVVDDAQAPGLFRAHGYRARRFDDGPDVGVLVKEAYQTVNPNEITIVARKYGYRTVIRKVPLRTSGTLRVDIWMSPDDGQAPIVEEAPPAIEEKTSSDAVFFGAGALALGLIGVAARRASRRPSTADSAPATA